MTGKEFNILDEIRGDIKNLLKAQAASEERVIHCRQKFTDIDTDIGDNMKAISSIKEDVKRLFIKLSFILGIGLTAIWFIEHFKIIR